MNAAPTADRKITSLSRLNRRAPGQVSNHSEHRQPVPKRGVAHRHQAARSKAPMSRNQTVGQVWVRRMARGQPDFLHEIDPRMVG
jgi:hypothetical protein